MEPYWWCEGEMRDLRIFKNGEDTGRRIRAKNAYMALDILSRDWIQEYNCHCIDIETTKGSMMAVIDIGDGDTVENMDIWEALEEENKT